MIFPNFNKLKKNKIRIVQFLVTSFIALAYEGVSSYLHIKRQKALQKTFQTMETNVDLVRIIIYHFKNSVIM